MLVRKGRRVKDEPIAVFEVVHARILRDDVQPDVLDRRYNLDVRLHAPYTFTFPSYPRLRYAYPRIALATYTHTPSIHLKKRSKFNHTIAADAPSAPLLKHSSDPSEAYKNAAEHLLSFISTVPKLNIFRCAVCPSLLLMTPRSRKPYRNAEVPVRSPRAEL